jgi:2-polyprenyl-6-methoxyphenol hydroxylase-like FAD-dependent oxidoreductase
LAEAFAVFFFTHFLSMLAVIVGAGLSGLSASIHLKRTEKYSRIHVLEKRPCHSRENFVLLSRLGTNRLKELGVYKEWKAQINRPVSETFQNVHLKGDVKALVSMLQQSGRLSKDNPADSIYLECADCMECPKDESDFSQFSPQDVLEYQDKGIGVEIVCIKDLEIAMAKVAAACGVEIHYNCAMPEWNVNEMNGVDAITVGDLSFLNPDLVLICEGASREISKNVLGLKEIRDSRSTQHILIQVDKYYGPSIFLSIGSR